MDLWSFALDRYARPGVEAACLAAQARGRNVCLLLCAAWLDSRRCARTAERQQALEAIAGPIEAEIVGPLRALRQQWKAAASGDAALAALRERLKTLELEAERLLCARLQQACENWPADATSAGQWLKVLEEPALARCLEGDASA